MYSGQLKSPPLLPLLLLSPLQLFSSTSPTICTYFSPFLHLSSSCLNSSFPPLFFPPRSTHPPLSPHTFLPISILFHYPSLFLSLLSSPPFFTPLSCAIKSPEPDTNSHSLLSLLLTLLFSVTVSDFIFTTL